MPVSPSAWDGIASRLPAKKFAFPIWRYASVAGIAAALAVGVFLLKPGATTDEGAVADVIISQEIPSITEQIEAAAAQSAVARTESSIAKAETLSEATKSPRQAASRPTAVTAPESIGNDVVEDRSFEEGQAAETSQAVEAGADSEIGAYSEIGQAPTEVQPEQPQQETAASDDSRLLAQLAAQEQAAAPRRFFLTASANLQGTGHQASSGRAAFRAPGKPAPEKTGISWENPEFNFTVPVTAGIGLQFNLNKHWSIGSGIQYTNMSRSFIGDYTEMQDDGDIFTLEQTDINNTQHWLGLPLNVYYEILPQSKWSLHAFAGGTVEYLLTNHYLVHTSGNDIHYSEAGKGVQLSVGGGLGVEYRFTPSFGLFFDPSLRFYFNNGQPRSIRTIQPLRMDFQAGVRFTL